MSDSEASILKLKQKRVSQLLKEISSYNDISILDIVLYCGFKEKQHSSFSKCAAYNEFPKFLNQKIDILLEKLEQGAKNPDLIYRFKESMIQEGKTNLKNPTKSYLVWIPCDPQLPVADFNGTYPPLSSIQIGEQKGIVTYRSTSRYEADGEFFVGQTGMATDIEPNTKIAIKRINKKLWKTDRYYVIMDSSNEISIYEMLPGDDEKTVKFVSTNTPEGPHKEFPFEEILAIFSIVDGNRIPIPKRKPTVVSNAQQQDLPPTESMVS